jgi:hypothetical protein
MEDLDGEAPGIQVDDLACACLPEAGSKTLRLFHVLGADADDGSDHAAIVRDGRSG